ncbi:c-type cytochrome [Methylophaga sp.]|uniref:c-type cytochrome n=1 Tax=Methylophaga sp. TaxID=2024840 RepID=UPI003F698153
MAIYHVMAGVIVSLSISGVHAQERNVALLASSCAACHGTNGHSVSGTPSLAGLDKMYFMEQMRHFKTGERPSTVMMKHASGYTEQEIRLLAEFFSQQK